MFYFQSNFDISIKNNDILHLLSTLLIVTHLNLKLQNDFLEKQISNLKLR